MPAPEQRTEPGSDETNGSGRGPTPAGRLLVPGVLVGLLVGLGVGVLLARTLLAPTGAAFGDGAVEAALADLGRPASDDDGPVVARVGDEVLTLEQFELRWNEVLGPRDREALTRRGGRDVYLEEVAEEILLAQEARRRGIPSRADVRETLRSALNHAISRPLLAEEVRDKAVAESELRALYELRKDEWGEPTKVRAREIRVADRALATRLAERARAGESFEELAREHSVAPTSRYGGEIGWVVPGRFVEEYEEAALALSTGEVSEPVATEDGWAVLLAEERIDESVPGFEDVRERLLDELLRDDPGAAARRYRLFIDELRRDGRTYELHPELVEPGEEPGDDGAASGEEAS